MRAAALLAVFLASCFPGAAQSPPVIIDTDVGHDDLMAIAFLLARSDVRVEAIAVDDGLAHVEAGAVNVLRLLALAGRRDVPVYIGSAVPMRGMLAFPAPWRRRADELGDALKLPKTDRKPEKESAADYLVRRLQDRSRPVRVLALGALTNFGHALERAPGLLRDIDFVMMGGAVRVPGNLGSGGTFKTDNKTAEWNLYVDPVADRMVFESGARILMVGLDATNKANLDTTYLREFEMRARTPLGEAVMGILERQRPYIEQGSFYAWDPLAAVAFVDPAVVKTKPLTIEIRQKAPEEGRTAEVAGGKPNVMAALDADGAAFRRIYLEAFIARK
jgi:inosine-uridine nucleoside N-ribohydrolase